MTQRVSFVPSENAEVVHEMKVLFVGAGNSKFNDIVLLTKVNFGSEEGPWNHSIRLEKKLGARLRVLGIIDPAEHRAQAVLETKKLTLAAVAYDGAKTFPTVSAATAALRCSPPDLILLGSPPAFRGRIESCQGLDVEKQLSDAFPSAAIFVEKPVSTGSVIEAKRVADLLESRKSNLVSVGYMLRYSKAIQRIKHFIEERNLTVMMTSARYIMAYENSRKLAWWNKSIDCGPIVEQATHFCDLSRYLGGEVDLTTIQAHSIEWYEKPGKLSKMNVDENLIPEGDRIPRFTSASWKYQSGAIGHLEHGVALQGTEFSTEIAVFADGYQFKLVDPYNRPTLYIRQPGSDAEETHNFHDDDPFLSEISTLIDTYDKTGAAIPVLSSYADAVKTYELTWAIREASEKSAQKTL